MKTCRPNRTYDDDGEDDDGKDDLGDDGDNGDAVIRAAEAVVRLGGVSALLELLRSGSAKSKMEATAALATIVQAASSSSSSSSSALAQAVADQGGIPLLMDVLRRKGSTLTLPGDPL
jgi:hypothetical protein